MSLKPLDLEDDRGVIVRQGAVVLGLGRHDEFLKVNSNEVLPMGRLRLLTNHNRSPSSEGGTTS